MRNDPQREPGDWADIRLLIQAAAVQEKDIDWERLAEYLEIFSLKDRLAELKSCYERE